MAVDVERSETELRGRIAAERDELARAVSELRNQVSATTDVGSHAARRLAPLTAAAAAAGFLVAGGLGATLRIVAVRRRVSLERRNRSFLDRLTA